jgi:hypothetical protein
LVDFFISLFSGRPRRAGRYQVESTHQQDTPRLEANVSLLRIIAVCWVAYIFILYLIDWALVSFSADLRSLPILLYILHIAAALLLLGLAHSRRAQQRLGRAIVPLAIFCLSVLPLLITSLVAPFALGPILGVRGVLELRYLPIVCIGVLLAAWHYRWNGS